VADEVHYLQDVPEKEQWEIHTALLRRHAPIVIDDLEEPASEEPRS
jgi:hypothetical protein